MNEVTNTEIKKALHFVMYKGNAYAHEYANMALAMFVQTEVYTNSDINTQLTYVLCNFNSCRAPGHKEARQTLKVAKAMLSR